MGSLRRYGKKGTYHYRWSVNGRPFERTLGTTKRSEALRRAALIEADKARGLGGPARYDVTCDEAFEDVLADQRANGRRTIADAERRIKLHLQPYFGGRRLAGVSTADVRAFIAERQHAVVKGKKQVQRPVSNAEINRELQLLRRAFVLAQQAGRLLNRPHVPMLKEAAARSGFFSREEVERVESNLSESLRPVVRFAFLTGWRCASEVLPLQWRNVDLKAGEVRLDPGASKTGEPRVFPLTMELRTLLEARRTEHEQLQAAGVLCPWVFCRVERTRTGALRARRIRAFTGSWRTACREAGVPGRLVHDLRRSFVRDAVRAGIPEAVVMRLSGHKTRSVLERYNVTSEGDLRMAAARLDSRTTGASLGSAAAQ